MTIMKLYKFEGTILEKRMDIWIVGESEEDATKKCSFAKDAVYTGISRELNQDWIKK